MSQPQTSFGDAEPGGFGSPVADRVFNLLAPVVETVGIELVDVEWAGGTLRVVADAPGPDRISTDRLAEVNRLVSPILDQHDPIPGRYTLEVTSPGVERSLRRADHFDRAVGETVVVKTVSGVEPRRIKGLLRAFEDRRLTIEVTEIDGVDLTEEEPRLVDLADVASAKTAFDWGPGPKPGKGPRNRSGKQPGKGSGKQPAKKSARKNPSGKNKKNQQAQPKRSEDNR